MKNVVRLSHVDVSKGLGIIIVVLGHTIIFSLGDTQLFWLIYAFHMPFWFFISGYLFSSKRAPKDFFFAKVCGLFIPYIMFYALNIFVRVLLMVFNLDRYSDHLRLGGLWFIITLFIIAIAYYCFDKITIKFINNPVLQDVVLLIISIVFLVVGLKYSYLIKDTDNKPLATALVGFFFYELGFLYKRYVDDKIDTTDKYKSVLIRVILFIVGFGLLIAVYYLSKRNYVSVDMNTSRYGNPYWFIINALLGTFGFYFLCYSLQHNKALEFYGRNSLIILVTNPAIIKICLSVFRNILDDRFDNYLTMVCILTFIVTMVLSVFIANIVNKWFPFLVGKINLEK